MTLNEYLANLRQGIERLETYGFAESIIFLVELRAGKQAIVKAEVVLVDGSCLIVREYIDAKYRIERVSYAYHYQNSEGDVVFRYDNAAHKPTLEFSEHKHTLSGDIVQAHLPEIGLLIEEMIDCL